MILNGERKWALSSIVHSTGESVGGVELPKASPPDSVPESVELPISEHLKETGRPYLIKQLDADLAWDTLKQETKENAESIEEYFFELAKKGSYRSDKVGYKDFLRHYEGVTNTKHAPLSNKINVIAEFLRYQTRRKQYES